jgi:hypothetical protein
MGNYILVPFNFSDQIEQIIPQIEEVAQAGMTVIFLISYQANGFFETRRIRAELSINGMLSDRKALLQCSYEKQTRLAEERVSLAREILRRRGVEVIAYVYMNHLRSLLKSYKRNGGVHRVLLPRRNAIPIMAFLRRVIALFSVSKRFNSVPYLYSWREI